MHAEITADLKSYSKVDQKTKLVKGKPLVRVGRKATDSPKLNTEVDGRVAGRRQLPPWLHLARQFI